MSPISRSAFLGTLLAALAASACDKVPLLAPTNTTIRLVSSVGVLPLSGSTDITAVVIESAGTPVQNGTVVTFTSSLGNVEPREARTQNGQVTVRFTAGPQSGTATISAFSGGNKSDNLEIRVGAAAAGAVTLRVETAGGPSTSGAVALVATVLDTGGNALRGVPVNFVTDAGQLAQSTVFSNDAGEARNEIVTSTVAKVTARVGTGSSAPSADLTVKALASVTIAIPGTPTGGVAMADTGLPTVFALEHRNPAESNAIRDVQIDFGDGASTRTGPFIGTANVSYHYRRTGTFTVTATTTDALNLQSVSRLVVQVNERYSIPVTFEPNVSTGGVVRFTANAAPRTNSTIVRYEWDFGDGNYTVTTGNIITHRYTSSRTYLVRLWVTASNGDSGYAENDVRVTF
jgi:hypothetical protein